MRLDEGDVAALTEWAEEDYGDQVRGVWMLPLIPVFDWFVIDQTWIYYEYTLPLVIPLVFYTGLIIHYLAVKGLALFAPGPGAPERILAGAEPSLTLEGTVCCDDGDEPLPISLEFTDPAKNQLAYLHLPPRPWLRPGEKVTVTGFGSRRRPFRQGLLLTARTGEREWRRDSPSSEKRYEYVDQSG
ncbi:hypothetical protein [Streptomyces sp. NPDC058045]|uniref:hypothetical protein n=1 Tax=Streptomyces sp. NPDC058045 TaxID=3346311 RepID=UPI0036E1D734